MAHPQTSNDFSTPSDLPVPETEEELAQNITAHPLPTYKGAPKAVHERILDANPMLLLGLRNFFVKGRLPGDCLYGVLTDSYTKAIGHADRTTLQIVKPLSTYVQMYPPSQAWGDEEMVQHWYNEDGLVGRNGVREAWKFFCNNNL